MNTPLTVGAVAAALLLGGLTAQSPEMLEELKTQKLEQPFLKNGKWLTDYKLAKKAAEKEGKFIFAYFTRSYAP